MKATELVRQRIVYAENKFAELVLWRLCQPLAGSGHSFKYRLAYVVNEVCVLRYDNEGGKVSKLLADFQHDMDRWNDENSDT